MHIWYILMPLEIRVASSKGNFSHGYDSVQGVYNSFNCVDTLVLFFSTRFAMETRGLFKGSFPFRSGLF